MQYSRPMIELVYEIRRRVNADLKPGIKLANPDMFQELSDYYQSSKDTISKTLIKELFSMAGEPWASNLNKTKEAVAPRQVIKAYRGQVSLVEAKKPPSAASQDSKPVRIYRGQIVDE